MEPRVFAEPRRDRGVLVRAVVVTDDVDIEVFGDVLVDLGQELRELPRPVTAMGEALAVPSSTFIAANKLVVPCRT